MYDDSTLTIGYKLRSFFTLIFAVLYYSTTHDRPSACIHRATHQAPSALPCLSSAFPSPQPTLHHAIPSLLLVHAHSASKADDVAMVMSIS